MLSTVYGIAVLIVCIMAPLLWAYYKGSSQLSPDDLVELSQCGFDYPLIRQQQHERNAA